MSASFVAQNANKRSIVVDLKSPRGAEVVLALARRADVFLENFTPGTAARLGLGAERLLSEHLQEMSMAHAERLLALADRVLKDAGYIAPDVTWPRGSEQHTWDLQSQ